jgi:hypothetical protein
MARLPVADGGDGHQVWSVAVSTFGLTPCYVGSCHYGVVRPQVADWGDSPYIWRVAANIPNKQ